MLGAERAEIEGLYARVKEAYDRSPYSEKYAVLDYIDDLVAEAERRAEITLPTAVAVGIKEFVFQLTKEDPVMFWMPDLPGELTIESSIAARSILRAKEHFLSDPAKYEEIWREKLIRILVGFLGYLPPVAEGSDLTVTAVDVCTVPELVERLIGTLYDDDIYNANLYSPIRAQFERNLAAASGLTLQEAQHRPHAVVKPMESTKSAREIVSSYLYGTAFDMLFSLALPFSLPEKTRFEHHWIVAGSGHGKTQTLQYLIAKDLEAVERGERSIVVIDSQGDLIDKIAHLKFFADNPERLCLIDPTDIEYPVALNLFDVGLERINRYSQLDRERLINGILELYDFVIGSLLSAELTQKQGVVFRYITRLMLHIPNATVQTLRELMEPSGYDKYRPYIEKLQGTARAFFETEFQSKQFEDTKRQVVRRLWGILENSTFERMFSHPRNKLDLFSEMNSGKVILINTAKELLKQQGTEIFGRFFIAMIAQAAQERATIKERIPTFVYIDECQEYVDANVALILEQARKFNVGMVLAHQYIGQLAPKLHESLAANTSIKFAGGVSDRDARAFAGMLRCKPEFIEEQKKLHFAAFVRNQTEGAVAVAIPYGHLEKQPLMSDEEWQRVRDEMRSRYAVHYTEVEQHISAQLAGEPVEGTSSEPPRDPDDVDTKASTDW